MIISIHRLLLITTDFHFFLIFLLALIPTVLLILQNRSWRKKFPPGPRGLPFLGNLHQLGTLPHRSLHRLSSRHGPLMFLQLGSIPTLIISSAEVAKELFKNFDRVFAGRPLLYAADKLSYGSSDITFSSYGEYWREVRKIVIIEMLSPKRVQSFQAVREDELAFMISFIASSESGLINLSELSLFLSSNILCRVTFGSKYAEAGGGKSRFNCILKDVEILLGEFMLVDYFPWLGWIHKFDGVHSKLDKIFKELDNFYEDIIAEHVKSKKPIPEQEDLVDVLLRLHTDSSQNITLTIDQIKALLTDMFIASSDTSAVTIEWTMTELIKNPREMNKVQEEVRGIFNTKGMIREEDLSQLSYLKLVIKEAMRLHTPVPLLVPHETMENCTFFGFQIPAKTRVYINTTAISRDPKVWETPEEFKPERFLNNPIDFKGHDFEYIPFGAGRRGCPGINFAMTLVELVLANLLHSFNWELPPGLKREDINMEETFGLTMHKKIPLHLMSTNTNVVQ